MKSNPTLESLLSTLTANLSDEALLFSSLQADIAATISSHRIQRGLSQKALSDQLGVSQSLLSRWENGDVNYTLETLAKIAQALGIEMQSPYRSKTIPHYHSVKNITPFPGGWYSASNKPLHYNELKEE